MSRRTAHPPKFDHLLARQMHKEGLSYNEIARRLGADRKSISRVVDYKQMLYQRRFQRVWHQQGICPGCGGPKSRKKLLCRKCKNEAMLENVRPLSLLCEKCRQWKADEEFFRSNRAKEKHRRYRKTWCKRCQIAQETDRMRVTRKAVRT